jgi:hypothetical protein
MIDNTVNNNLIIKSIYDNKPIFIKNYFCENIPYKLINFIKHQNHNNLLLKGSSIFQNINIFFINQLVEKIKCEKNIILCNYFRSWNHSKNNVTPWHYDGDGCDVINICLSGKKKFILSPPNSHINFSFSNISIIDLHCKKYEYILEKGDLLLIPKFWYHKVITLKNNTITINLLAVQKNTLIPENIKTIYLFHNLFKTKMSKVLFLQFNIIKQSVDKFIFHYIKELFQLFLIVLFLQKTNLLNHTIFKISTFVSLIILNAQYSNSSLGITTIVLVHLIALLVYTTF